MKYGQTKTVNFTKNQWNHGFLKNVVEMYSAQNETKSERFDSKNVYLDIY